MKLQNFLKSRVPRPAYLISPGTGEQQRQELNQWHLFPRDVEWTTRGQGRSLHLSPGRKCEALEISLESHSKSSSTMVPEDRALLPLGVVGPS